MRVILDTNILCSALITPDGSSDRLYRAWREGRFELLTSDEQLDELKRVTRYPRVRQYIEPSAAGAMCNELRELATIVGPLPLVEGSRDPADNFLLSMAKAGNADFLVTGDKHDLLSIGVFEQTRIVSAGQMLEEIKPRRKRGSKSTAKARKRRKRAPVTRLS